jgi:DNA-binding response OmpR family regulator
MGEEHKTILAVSPDRQIARFRHEALTEAGFYVISVHSEAAARYEIHFGRCGILLLCHKLNKLAREALANDFHTMCQEPFIVAFLAHERDHYPPQTHVRMLHSRDLSHLVATLRQRLAA